MIANPEVIELLSKRDKCWSCRHKFSKSVILPVDKPQRGKYQPNYNPEFFYHLYETHGIPDDIARDWIFGLTYGLELTEMGVRF